MSILLKELRQKFWGFIEAIVNLWINVLLYPQQTKFGGV